jgi:hypothetical protein
MGILLGASWVWRSSIRYADAISMAAISYEQGCYFGQTTRLVSNTNICLRAAYMYYLTLEGEDK